MLKVLATLVLCLTICSTKAEAADQVEILQRIVEAEATGGTVEQKANVARCILARMAAGWGDTVEAVVFAPGQFAPISDGRYYTVTVTEATRTAVDMAIKTAEGFKCTYFCTPTCASARNGYHSRLRFKFCDGIHNYYERR